MGTEFLDIFGHVMNHYEPMILIHQSLVLLRGKDGKSDFVLPVALPDTGIQSAERQLECSGTLECKRLHNWWFNGI